MNLATVAVLHTAMALEDPFDNQGLDGIYVDEALFEAEQVTHSAFLPQPEQVSTPLETQPLLLLRQCRYPCRRLCEDGYLVCWERNVEVASPHAKCMVNRTCKQSSNKED